MYNSQYDHPDVDLPGRPFPPWRDTQDEPNTGIELKTPLSIALPAAAKKTVSTLASELRSLVFRDRRTRTGRDCQ